MRRFDLLHRGRIDRRQSLAFARHTSRTRESRRGFLRGGELVGVRVHPDETGLLQHDIQARRSGRGCRLCGNRCRSCDGLDRRSFDRCRLDSRRSGFDRHGRRGLLDGRGLRCFDRGRRCRHFERVRRRNRDRSRTGFRFDGRCDRSRFCRVGNNRRFDRSRFDVYRCRLRLDSGRRNRFGVVLDRCFGDDGACRSRGHDDCRCGRVGRFGSSRCFRRHGLHGGFAICALLGVVDDCAVFLALAATAAAAATATATFLAITRAGFRVGCQLGAGQGLGDGLVGVRFRMRFATVDRFERSRMLGRLAALAALATFLTLATAGGFDAFRLLGTLARFAVLARFTAFTRLAAFARATALATFATLTAFADLATFTRLTALARFAVLARLTCFTHFLAFAFLALLLAAA
ncbi:hypothetical protein HT748_38770, partial [Burkholderia cepacia]|nr:hypothetical protein [Burkholderia cepacia]